jgi:hypothetical protein
MKTDIRMLLSSSIPHEEATQAEHMKDGNEDEKADGNKNKNAF